MKNKYETPDIMFVFWSSEIATGLEIVGGSGSSEDWESGMVTVTDEQI